MGVPFQEFRRQIPKTFLCISCILPDSKIKCNRRGEKFYYRFRRNNTTTPRIISAQVDGSGTELASTVAERTPVVES